MTKIRIDARALAYMLDLPEGATLGSVEHVEGPEPTHDYYEFELTAEGWPDGLVSLTYNQDENGVISLVGYDEL